MSRAAVGRCIWLFRAVIVRDLSDKSFVCEIVAHFTRRHSKLPSIEEGS